MKKDNISDAVIRRLPRYYRHLTDLQNRGIIRISSHSLGQELGISRQAAFDNLSRTEALLKNMELKFFPKNATTHTYYTKKYPEFWLLQSSISAIKRY